jgi:hypothetical protein
MACNEFALNALPNSSHIRQLQKVSFVFFLFRPKGLSGVGGVHIPPRGAAASHEHLGLSHAQPSGVEWIVLPHVGQGVSGVPTGFIDLAPYLCR